MLLCTSHCFVVRIVCTDAFEIYHVSRKTTNLRTSLFEVRSKEGGFTLSLRNLCKIIRKGNALRHSICGLRALWRPSAPFVTHKGITTDKWPLFLLQGLRQSLLVKNTLFHITSIVKEGIEFMSSCKCKFKKKYPTITPNIRSLYPLPLSILKSNKIKIKYQPLHWNWVSQCQNH